MTSLDGIWEAEVAPRSPSREPVHDEQARARNDPLFLPEDDDDQMPDAPPRRTEPEIDVTAVFAAVDNLPDDDDTRSPALTPHQILSSSPAHHLDDNGDKGEGKNEKDGKKPKKKTMRLDEGRLIDCFPQLIEDTKNIKIKGKGHEASDLNRLLQVYQFWTHRLYPKTPFKDTVDRVEKLCHSKRMHHTELGMARRPGEDEEGRDPIDLTDDSNPAPDSDQADYASSSSHEATRPPSSVDGDGDARSSSVDRDFNEETDIAAMDAAAKFNAREASMGRQQQTEPTEPPSSAAQFSGTAAPSGEDGYDNDQDIEAEIAAAEAAELEAKLAEARPPVAVDDEEYFWGILEETASNPPTSTARSIPKRVAEDDLGEDWEALDAMDVDGN
ncbi:Chromosome segregation in meiosis protein [Mycena venus]|uniref:Chromosome segregation in meiosis protein n=1 Tax=Mycena venus TaxID=2733690 RepID=A0A8H6XD31_9AGAR|nr:Chromosome segregation in meiosis protein [Mycena venus]